jgi:K+-transporting ATPase c subunit
MKESTGKKLHKAISIFIAVILIGSIVFPLIITILGF